MTRRALSLVVGLVLAVAALASALLAYDALAWHAELRDSDARYEVSPTAPGLWHPDTVLPASTSRRALGIDDDLKYRVAIRSFRLTQPRNPLAYGAVVQSQRAVAQIRLAEVVREDPRARRKAIAANLLGILALASAPQTPEERLVFFQGALASFQNAIELDPTLEDAKHNLELALRRVNNEEENFGLPRGVRPREEGSEAGIRDPGSGY